MQADRLLAAMLANAAAGNPALLAAGLNPPIVGAGAGGLLGQAQLAQVSLSGFHFKCQQLERNTLYNKVFTSFNKKRIKFLVCTYVTEKDNE